MKNRFTVLFASLFTLLFIPNSATSSDQGVLLSEFAKQNLRPWLSHEANSEQRQPIYIGASPREMEIEGRSVPKPILRSVLKKSGAEQALKISKILKEPTIQFEAWPFQNDEGDQAWAFARWRKEANDPWNWLEEDHWKGKNTFEAPAPALPVLLRPWIASERNTLFKDFLELDSLYDKPVFGDAIWTSADGLEIIDAWIPLTSKKEMEKKVLGGKRFVARVLPQPARFNSQPISFIIRVAEGEVTWPEEIEWREISGVLDLTATEVHHKVPFPATYADEYKKWVDVLAGEDRIFKRKNSADPKNELEKIADYFEKYYTSELGLKVRRQKFKYRGQDQSNLIVVIPGTLPPAENHPILFADHYDTAFEEDTFEESGKRVGAAGADDNATATVSLLMAAKILKDSHPKHDIWLVHLTGEEYPADDLGARHFLGCLLKEKINIQGLVLIDMIGHRKRGDLVFQLNLGMQDESKEFGRIALSLAAELAPQLSPKIRGRFDELSYLYNTDGYIFTNLGFPVIYFNEHMDRKTMGANPHYHQSTDIPKNVDFSYAVPISQTAIATVWELANRN